MKTSQVLERPSRFGLDKVGVVPSNVKGVQVEECGVGMYRQTVFIFDNFEVALTDTGSAGSGSQQFYEFPQGIIDLIGVAGRLTYRYSASWESTLKSEIKTLTDVSATGVIFTPISGGEGSFFAFSPDRCGFLDGSMIPEGLSLAIQTTGDPGGNQILKVSGTLVVSWANLGGSPNV